jgi:hypothetical protein
MLFESGRQAGFLAIVDGESRVSETKKSSSNNAMRSGTPSNMTALPVGPNGISGCMSDFPPRSKSSCVTALAPLSPSTGITCGERLLLVTNSID